MQRADRQTIIGKLTIGKLTIGKLTIGKKITLLAASMVALSALQGASSWWHMRAVEDNVTVLVDDAMPGMESIGGINTAMGAFRGDVFQHMFSGSARDMAEAEQRQRTTRGDLATAMATYEKYMTQPEDRNNFNQLRQYQAAFFEAWEQTVQPLSRKGRSQQAFHNYSGRMLPQFLASSKQIAKMRDWNYRRGLQAARAAQAASASSQIWVKTLVPLTVLLGIFLSWFTIRGVNTGMRKIVGELSQGGDQVSAAASQIASSSQSLSQGASQQAASLEQVSASMEQMAAMTKRNAENSSQAMAMMVETAAQVERSNTAVRDMETSMAAMKTSSEKVAKINKTIDEIAFQTNILALNAAVEAARAGSAGMGFAVVAGEVRNLAQRSAVAAKDTAVLIGEAIASSNESVAKLDHVSQAIRAITEGAGKVKSLVDEVNEASKQQAQGIEQVAAAISQVNQVTQTTAASAEQSAAASQQLSAQSGVVRELVASLEALVDGAREVVPALSSSVRPGAGTGRPLAFKAARPAPKSAGSAAVGLKTAAARQQGAVSAAEKLFPMETPEGGGFHNF